MQMNVNPIPTLDPRINEIRELTARIVNHEILPNERKLWLGWRADASDEERQAARQLRESIKHKVKQAGLWAPHLPPEYGGAGLSFLEHAYMNEVLAYTVGAASLFGVVAPNSGNQKILLKYGTEEQKKKWLVPLTEGKMESGFSMTEPDSAGSDPRSIKTTARREGDQWVINGHKWFTSNGFRADFLIVMWPLRLKEASHRWRHPCGSARPPIALGRTWSDMKHTLMAVAALAILTSPRILRAEDAPGVEPNQASNYVGVWQLDRQASESIGPLLELMDAPWVASKMADIATPTLTITAPGGSRLRMINQNPLRTTDREIIADGAEREATDALGHKVVESATWNKMGQLVVTQQNHIEDDRVVEVTSTWSRNGDSLELTLHSESGQRPLSIRRVFRPKP